MIDTIEEKLEKDLEKAKAIYDLCCDMFSE